MVVQTQLEQMLIKAARTPGVERLEIVNNIRRYVKTLSEQQLIAEINNIKTPQRLRNLMEVGVPGEAWKRLVQKITEIEKQ